MAPSKNNQKKLVVQAKRKPTQQQPLRKSVPVDTLALARFYINGENVQEGILRIRDMLKGKVSVPGRVRKALMKTLTVLEMKSNVGPADMHDDVMTITSAPRDIPPVPLSGFQFLERRVRVAKLATQGTTAGGFYATLICSDFNSYTAGFFRIKRITSWTAPTNSATESQFAGLQTSGAVGSEGTESLPSWTEDWTRIGEGFAGIDVQYPLGDFLLFPDSSSSIIATHFTGLGGASGVTGIPVVFDVIAELLI